MVFSIGLLEDVSVVLEVFMAFAGCKESRVFLTGRSIREKRPFRIQKDRKSDVPLFIRTSSLSDRALNSSAAFLTDSREDKSNCRNVTLALGLPFLISAIADSALDGFRAAR